MAGGRADPLLWLAMGPGWSFGDFVEVELQSLRAAASLKFFVSKYDNYILSTLLGGFQAVEGPAIMQ